MQGGSQNIILNKQYQILEKIGSGSFGYIYVCQDITVKDKKLFAVKLEKKGKGDGQLQYEIKLYQIFSGIPGIAKMYDYGLDGQRLYMVLDLLSHSLEDLFQLCGKMFSINTVLNIGIQIITRLEAIHRKGFVHRDIKANNFMIGKRDKVKTVYIIDFGLAKRYKDTKTGKHISPKGGKSLVGTARYASIASHCGFQQCRRDDLESLGYLLLYFLRGKLPWQGIQINNKIEKYEQIGRIKQETSIEKICKQISPSAWIIAKYMDEVKSIGFQDEPNYDMLRKLLREQIIKREEENAIIDWEPIVAQLQQKDKEKKQKFNK